MRRKTMTVLVAATLAGVPAAPAGAQDAVDWKISARAGASDMVISTTGGFIVDRIDPGGAVAMSDVETVTDEATSLASAPYPSEIGEQGPGLLYGVLQNLLPYNGIPFPELPTAPAWPWTVRASANGSDPPQASLGDASSPFRLKTSAASKEAAASADAGGAQPGALGLMHLQATTTIDAKEAGKAKVIATSLVENLMIGGQLSIGEIRTTLELVRVAGSDPQVAVKRSITGISVGGVAAEWTPKGFVFQGTTTPLPDSLLEGLRSAGIELEVGGDEKVPGGIKARGLTVRMPFDFTGMSDDQLPFSAPHTMTLEMTFGTVSASIEQVGGEQAIAFQLAAATSPGGLGGPEARDEMGMLGWIAQGGAIALVVLLVVGRARRAVISK